MHRNRENSQQTSKLNLNMAPTGKRKEPTESVDQSLHSPPVTYENPLFDLSGADEPGHTKLAPGDSHRNSRNKGNGMNQLSGAAAPAQRHAYSGHFILSIPTEPEPYISNVLEIEPRMRDWFHEESPPHPFYIQYRMYQAKALNNSTRTFLSNHLNGDVTAGLSSKQKQKDWKGLADCMGKEFNFTLNLERFRDPTRELLLTWQTEEGSTIGRFLGYLRDMDRFDILEDIKFMDLIKDSCKEYDMQREKLLREEESLRRNIQLSTNWTVGDVQSDGEELFDAFVCFSVEDFEFMGEMLLELEEHEEGPRFKLCLDVRDILHPDDHVITAEIIKQRCKRTIVILSSNFVKEDNRMCEYAMRVAQSLSPAASRSKIIPILIDPKCQVPTSLRHLTLVDHTRVFQKRFMWTKIRATLRDESNQLYLVEQEKLRHVILEPPTEGRNARDEIYEKMAQKKIEKSEKEASLALSVSSGETESSSPSSESNNIVSVKVVSSSPSGDSPDPSLRGKKHSAKKKKVPTATLR